MTYKVTIVLVHTISSTLFIILATFDVNHFRQEIKSRYQEKEMINCIDFLMRIGFGHKT